MPDWDPVTAIVGAGAVGGYYGCRLAQHGRNVHFLVRSDYETILRDGWIVRSCDGDVSLAPGGVYVYNDSRHMPRADLVIVAIKATSNDAYEPLIRPLLHERTLILTLQNGLGNEERLAELFGAERILGGLAFVCLHRSGPGRIQHTDHGLIRVGDFTEGRTDHADRIVTFLKRACIRCDRVESLRYGRWEKLTWNVPFSGLGAVLDLTTDKLIGSLGGLKLLRDIGAEIVAAAAAYGVNLPSDIMETKIRQTQTMGAYQSSMQIDREMGRPMEVEAILGEPARAAARAGVSTPNLNMLYELAKLVNLGNL